VVGPEDWVRWTYGNSYRYNERKLFRRETGLLNAPISRVETYCYELGRSNLSYQPIIGATRQYQGDGLAEAVLRPLKVESTQQDGVNYVRTVNTFDSFARPVRITESSTSGP
jgi:hypothetical protein